MHEMFLHELTNTFKVQVLCTNSSFFLFLIFDQRTERKIKTFLVVASTRDSTHKAEKKLMRKRKIDERLRVFSYTYNL